MPVSEPLSSELHSLLVNPRNSSLILGAADYLTYRPAQGIAGKLSGKKNPLPSWLSPAKWGEQAARAGEKIDYALGSAFGHARKEDIKLDAEHIDRIADTLKTLRESSDPQKIERADQLERHLDNLIGTHSHPDLNFQKILAHRNSPNFSGHTLHGVALPSVGGELGKKVKHFGTDAATLVGSATIMNHLYGIEGIKQQNKQEDAQRMDTKIARIQEALVSLEKAAAILEDIPRRDEALKRASDLYATGAISMDEIDKYASVFYTSPEASDVLVQTAQRFTPTHAKTARLGEVIPDISANDDRSGDSRGSNFDNFCRAHYNR